MVRLKDINVIDIYNDLNKFQFLMVRLKENQGTFSFDISVNFNSLWCD